MCVFPAKRSQIHILKHLCCMYVLQIHVYILHIFLCVCKKRIFPAQLSSSDVVHSPFTLFAFLICPMKNRWLKMLKQWYNRKKHIKMYRSSVQRARERERKQSVLIFIWQNQQQKNKRQLCVVAFKPLIKNTKRASRRDGESKYSNGIFIHRLRLTNIQTFHLRFPNDMLFRFIFGHFHMFVFCLPQFLSLSLFLNYFLRVWNMKYLSPFTLIKLLNAIFIYPRCQYWFPLRMVLHRSYLNGWKQYAHSSIVCH